MILIQVRLMLLKNQSKISENSYHYIVRGLLMKKSLKSRILRLDKHIKRQSFNHSFIGQNYTQCLNNKHDRKHL